jgi:hypothetical protein
MPDQGLVLGHFEGVDFVTLDGEIIARLPGFRLYFYWTVPGPVIVRNRREYFVLDHEKHELQPLGSRDEVLEFTSRSREEVGQANVSLLEEPDEAGAPGAPGSWTFAIPSPDGSKLLAEWFDECDTRTAYFARADGSNPVPVTGERGLADAPFSSVIGWTADGGAIVFRGPNVCGLGEVRAGVYRFDRPGVGAMVIPFERPNSVRMWGTG